MKIIHRFLRSQAGSAPRMDILLPKLEDDIVVKTLEVRFSVETQEPEYTIRVMDASSGAILTMYERNDSHKLPFNSEILEYLTKHPFIQTEDSSGNILVQIPFAWLTDLGSSPLYLETGLNMTKDLVLRIDANSNIKSASVFMHGVFHSKKTITPFVSKELISTVGTGGRMKFVLPSNTVHIYTRSTDGNAVLLKVAVYDGNILLSDLETFGEFSFTARDASDILESPSIETVDILKPNYTYTVVAYSLKTIDNTSIKRAFKISSDQIRFNDFRDLVLSDTML